MTSYSQDLAAVATTPVLLVACDYDGTLAPIVSHPPDAHPDPAAIGVLKKLGELPHTHLAVISGRSMADLRRFVGNFRGLHLAGSHGAEIDGDTELTIPTGGPALLDRVVSELHAIADRVEGATVEEKPHGVAFHYRNSPDRLAEVAIRDIMAGPAQHKGVHVLSGHKVLELTVVKPDKGRALNYMRRRLGASRVIFIGDDVTDETAFETLPATDLSIKIGAGETSARHRVETQADTAPMLEEVYNRRAAWLAQRNIRPIERHSMLSDQRTVVLVDDRARVVWGCFPRIDSPAIFSELLADEQRGCFEITPADAGPDDPPPSQSYIGDTFILQTRFKSFRITEYLDCVAGLPYQRAGRTDHVRIVEGNGVVKLHFRPRLDFGRTPTRLMPRENGIEIDGWTDPAVLFSPGVDWTITDDGYHQTATAEHTLTGEPLLLEFRYGTASLRPSVVAETERRRQTARFWGGWLDTLDLPEIHSDLVRRSALALKALCHGPSGAICAAATMSLPEHLGGIRNWDYRYCWPRDAAMSAAALVRLGNTGVAVKLLDWIVGVVDTLESPDRLRPIYTVTGSMLGPEGEIAELLGYGDSKPVRIGNAASHQVQLDVFGPIVDLVALLIERGGSVTPQYWRLVEAMVHAVAARWNEPDHGIWEIRGPKRHHVHSRVMCWWAVDRAIAVADHLLGRARPDWAHLRDTIKEDVLTHGWNEEAGAYTTAYGDLSLDAATLWIGITGLTPPTDPRFLKTIEAIEKHLVRDDLVYRYLCDDGLPGIEGAFLICTTWLVEAYTLVGRHDDARRVLSRVAALAGPTGLLTEEYDPTYKIALGNFPQAYSHLGVLSAAVRLRDEGTKGQRD